MPITCTLEDLASLRDRPGSAGPLSKLQAADDKLPLMERARIARWLKPILAKLASYEQDYLALLKKHGTSRVDPASKNLFFDLPEPATGESADEIASLQKRRDEYDTAVKKLQETTVELEVAQLPVATYDKLPLSSRDLLLLEKFVILPVITDVPAA